VLRVLIVRDQGRRDSADGSGLRVSAHFTRRDHARGQALVHRLRVHAGDAARRGARGGEHWHVQQEAGVP